MTGFECVESQTIWEMQHEETEFVDSIEVPLSRGLVAEVSLDWEANGPTRSEWFREPGMCAFHRIRDADVTGTVTITSGGSKVLTVTGADETGDARITRYSEIQW